MNGSCSGQGSQAGTVTLVNGAASRRAPRARLQPVPTPSGRRLPGMRTSSGRRRTASRSRSARAPPRPRRRCTTRRVTERLKTVRTSRLVPASTTSQRSRTAAASRSAGPSPSSSSTTVRIRSSRPVAARLCRRKLAFRSPVRRRSRRRIRTCRPAATPSTRSTSQATTRITTIRWSAAASRSRSMRRCRRSPPRCRRVRSCSPARCTTRRS